MTQSKVMTFWEYIEILWYIEKTTKTGKKTGITSKRSHNLHGNHI